MQKYDHRAVEKKWQKIWKESNAFKTPTDASKRKYYVLDMFPYPSGAGLHVGHPKGYIASDIQARKRRMEGYAVLHPMGWDAFGLPAENYAIKTGTPPQKTTDESIATFKKQISNLGLSYDWDCEIATHTPEYYTWTQWLFLQFFKKGLVYKKKALVNWDPVDQTVLANEQVLPDGTAERSGAKVEKKDLEQWFFKITDYADELIEGLDLVDWPESTKINQRNWIGRSEGAEIDFSTTNSDKKIKVFTTRPDTLFGATYLVVAPEHPFVKELIEKSSNKDEILRYIVVATQRSDIERNAEGKEKTGVEIKGVKAINPVNNEEIPVFVADYVLRGYGTGAIMAVPAHDDRDFEFAQKYNLPIKQVIAPYTVMTGADAPKSEENIIKFDAATAILRHWEDKNLYYAVEFSNGRHAFPGGHVEPGETTEETVRHEVLEESGYKNIAAVKVLFEHCYSRGYKPRKTREELCHDSIFIVDLVDGERVETTDHEIKNGRWMSQEEILTDPVFVNHHKFYFQHHIENRPYTGTGILVNSTQFNDTSSEEAKKKITESIGGKMVKTYRLRDWLISRQRYWGAPIPVVYDPTGRPHAIPEEHLPWVLPTDVEYLPKGTSPLGTSKELLARTEDIFGKGWTPEIDTMDTFVCSSWYYLRFADPHNRDAFASKKELERWLPVDLYIGGAEHTVLHLMYARFFTKALRDMGYLSFDEPFMKLRHQGLILAEDGRKMSKRWGNVVNPDDMVERFGADALRIYEMFMGPFEQQIAWNTNGVVGAYRFLERVWDMQKKLHDVTADEKTEVLLQQTIDKVSQDIEAFKFNTAVSSLMIFSNYLSEIGQIPKYAYLTFIQLLAPFAPHIAHELAERVESARHVWEVWPIADVAKLIYSTARVAVQINGKMRTTIELSVNASEVEALAAARADASVAKWLSQGREVKAIYVPGKVINFVLEAQQ
jgi:leucyl-tRNA synthetase